MRISDWSSDVCSSDLYVHILRRPRPSTATDVGALAFTGFQLSSGWQAHHPRTSLEDHSGRRELLGRRSECSSALFLTRRADVPARSPLRSHSGDQDLRQWHAAMPGEWRSEEHTSELKSLMRTSYAVFCLKHKHPQRILIYH